MKRNASPVASSNPSYSMGIVQGSGDHVLMSKTSQEEAMAFMKAANLGTSVTQIESMLTGASEVLSQTSHHHDPKLHSSDEGPGMCSTVEAHTGTTGSLGTLCTHLRLMCADLLTPEHSSEAWHSQDEDKALQQEEAVTV